MNEVYFDDSQRDDMDFENRIVSTSYTPTEDEAETSLRPRRMGDYIGQDKAKENLQVYIASLVKTLHAATVKDLILKNRQGILLNTRIVDCDYYRFLEGDARAVNSFTGQYMSAYSWAEFTVGYLENQMQKIK